MSTPTFRTLHPDRPLRLDGRCCAELRIEAGTVWITVDGAAGDVFLGAGGSFRLTPRDAILAEAVRGPAQVRLVPLANRAARLATPLRTWFSRLAAG